MSELINLVLNAKIKDIPKEFRITFKDNGNYHIAIEFEDSPEVAVSEVMGWSYIKLHNLDPEARIIDIIEDAKKLIEKYKAKTRKMKRSKEA